MRHRRALRRQQPRNYPIFVRLSVSSHFLISAPPRFRSYLGDNLSDTGGRADLEEKQEPRGTLSANADPNAGERRREVSKIALDEWRDREADVRSWGLPTAAVDPNPPFRVSGMATGVRGAATSVAGPRNRSTGTTGGGPSSLSLGSLKPRDADRKRPPDDPSYRWARDLTQPPPLVGAGIGRRHLAEMQHHVRRAVPLVPDCTHLSPPPPALRARRRAPRVARQ